MATMFLLDEMARSSEWRPDYALDTADIVRDGCYRQRDVGR
jgi:hypothetical protein